MKLIVLGELPTDQSPNTCFGSGFEQSELQILVSFSKVLLQQIKSYTV